MEETIRGIDARINEYVSNDTTTYYLYERYEAGVQAMIDFCNLRAESIAGQLDGTIPSTIEGQSADSSALIDASSLNLNDLGSLGGGGMGGGRGFFNMPGGN